MIRLMGILTGSAIAIALLIVTLGLPEFSPRSPEPAHERAQESVEPPLAQEIPEVPPSPVAETLVEAAAVEPSVAPAESAHTERQQPEQATEQLATAGDLKWYAFWSPFRSAIAADGFVAELQRTTGLDNRVVKLKPGSYEVAFAYADDDDIQEKLARISKATGLDMSGG